MAESSKGVKKTTERPKRTKAQKDFLAARKKVYDKKFIKVDDPDAPNGERRVPIWPGRPAVHVGQDEIKTTTTLSGKQIQYGLESSVQDLGFSNPQSFGNRIVDIIAAEFMRSREVKFTAKAFMPGARLYPFFDDIDVSDDCKPDGGSYGDPLVCDTKGRVNGTFLIPNRPGKKFKVGDRIFRLTSSPTNAVVPPPASFADANYTARGWVDTKQETTFSTRLYNVDNKFVTKSSPLEDLTQSTTRFEVQCPSDPIAQSFFIYEDGGCYITDIDIFFYSKDENVPVKLQVRPLDDGGNPSIKVLPFGEIVKESHDVILNVVDLTQGTLTVTGNPISSGPDAGVPGVTSGPWTTLTPVKNTSGTTIVSGTPIPLSAVPADDMIPTRFTFESPIYLAKNQSYVFVLIADSIKYNVWIAQSGPDITGRDGVPAFRDAGEVNQNIGTSDNIAKDPYIQGVYFKSQNGISWTADQTIDMKFVIHKAVFDTSINGEIEFLNDPLPARQLILDPIETHAGSNKIRITHPNHGMPGGEPRSRVLLTGVTGNANGHLLSDINATEGHLIDNVELDSYTITLLSTASATGKIGGTSCFATENKRYEELLLITTPLVLPETNIAWNMTGTTSRGVHDSINTSYLKSSVRNILPNTNVIFNTPRHISSSRNEQNSGDTPDGPSPATGSELGSRKSLRIKAILSSENSNLSPVVDVSRLSVVTTANRIDNPAGFIPLGSTIDPASVINDVFDDFVCIPSTDAPAVADTANKLTFVVPSDPDALSSITTTDSDVAVHLSKLDVGKLLTCSGCATSSRNFGNIYIIEVNYTPNDTVKCEIVIDKRFVSGGTDTGASITITQKDRYIDEIAPTGGSCSTKYVSKQLSLARASNALKIMFDANRHRTNTIDLYYKLQLVDNKTPIDSVNWTLAEYNLDVAGDIQIKTPVPNGNVDQFSAYECNLLDLPSFIGVQIKLVMRGGNPAQSPRIKNLQIIALDE